LRGFHSLQLNQTISCPLKDGNKEAIQGKYFILYFTGSYKGASVAQILDIAVLSVIVRGQSKENANPAEEAYSIAADPLAGFKRAYF